MTKPIHSYIYYIFRALRALDKALALAETREDAEKVMWAIEILKGKDDTVDKPKDAVSVPIESDCSSIQTKV